MKHEVIAEFSEALVKLTTRRFLAKSLGWDYLAAWLIMLISFSILVAFGWRNWFVGALGAALGIAALGTVMIWVVLERRALDALRKMTNPLVTFKFDDNGVAISSDISTGTLKWQAIQALWCFPEVWLFFVAKGVYSTLPTACLTDETRQFVIEKLRAEGAKISQ